MIAFLSYHAGQHLIFIAMLVIHVTMHWGRQNRRPLVGAVHTWFLSCRVFNPAPYQAPVAVMAATAPVIT